MSIDVGSSLVEGGGGCLSDGAKKFLSLSHLKWVLSGREASLTYGTWTGQQNI